MPPQLYFDILDKVIEYHKTTYFWCFFGFAILTILIILIPKAPKKRPPKQSKYQYHPAPKKEVKKTQKSFYFKLVAWLLVATVCICGIIYTNHQIRQIETDIENSSFVTFTGNFQYYRYRGKGTDYFFTRIDLLDETQNIIDTVHYPDYQNYHSTYDDNEYRYIEEGIYQGTLIYTKESGLVVDLQIDK